MAVHVMLIHSHGHCKRVYLTDLSKTSHFRPTQTGFFGSLGHVCSVPLFCRDHMINTEHSAKVHTQTSHFMSRLQRVWSYKAAAPSAHRSKLNTLHIIYSHLSSRNLLLISAKHIRDVSALNHTYPPLFHTAHSLTL